MSMSDRGMAAFACRGAGLLLLTAAAACTNEDLRPTLPPGQYVDTFQQVAASKIDVLWVVDNSPSMVEEQDNLAQNFNQFLGFLTRAQTDFHIAVTTTDVVNDQGRLIVDRNKKFDERRWDDTEASVSIK